MATVRLHGPLKRLAGGQAEHDVEGASVGAALSELERAHPALAGWILDERGCIRRHLNIYVNGEPGCADGALRAGDRVAVLPAISGGR